MSSSSGNTVNRTETMISLQWSHFETFILKGLSNMFATIDEFADVTLVCGDGRSFKAHKLVLSMWSPYFRAIFLNNACDHPVIILRDMKSEDIQVILHFIYEGQALLHPENETRILETAVSLQIAGFLQMKEPTPITTSSTPVPGSSSQIINTGSGSRSIETEIPLQKPQHRHTIVGISPIPIPTTMEESQSAIIVTETPTGKTSSKPKTQVYKPHKRQKIEVTPTKSSDASSSSTSPTKSESNVTTMYSMDQQKIIVTEQQEIPRCSSSSQEMEYIEIINISPDQNSVTLNLGTELDTTAPLEPVQTGSSFAFHSPTPEHSYYAHAQTHAQVQSAQAQALVTTGPSPGQGPSITSTPLNHKTQTTEPGSFNKSKFLQDQGGAQTIATPTPEFVPCPKCGKTVKETSLRVHISRTHLEEGTILVCPICSKVINSKGVYYKHMFLHRKKDKKSTSTVKS